MLLLFSAVVLLLFYVVALQVFDDVVLQVFDVIAFIYSTLAASSITELPKLSK